MLLDDGLLEYVSFPVLGFWRERLVVVCSKKMIHGVSTYPYYLLVIDYSASRAVEEGWTIPYIVKCVQYQCRAACMICIVQVLLLGLVSVVYRWIY